MKSCYKAVPRPLSWAAATQECLYLDASLASIADDETVDFLATLDATENVLVGVTKWGEGGQMLNPNSNIEFSG